MQFWAPKTKSLLTNLKLCRLNTIISLNLLSLWWYGRKKKTFIWKHNKHQTNLLHKFQFGVRFYKSEVGRMPEISTISSHDLELPILISGIRNFLQCREGFLISVQINLLKYGRLSGVLYIKLYVFCETIQMVYVKPVMGIVLGLRKFLYAWGRLLESGIYSNVRKGSW